jgi:twinkle protein
MNALEYIQDRGFEHKEQAGQIVLKTCPYCGDQKNHFYMDPGEGTFYCHKCQERGNLITLKKHLGDWKPNYNGSHKQNPGRKPMEGVVRAFSEKGKAYPLPDEKKAFEGYDRLLRDAEALAYLREARGISEEALKHFKLGLEEDKDQTRWLTIPHYEKGKLINIKSRSLPPAEKEFRRVKGCRSILFNGDIIEENLEEIFITEGELDAVTLWDQGIKNIVTGTTGAGSFESSWIDQLAKVRRIVLCYDGDEAGEKGARELARRLGYDRCFKVVLPDGQDVNDFFTSGHDIFDFQGLVNAAKRFDVAGILSFQEGMERYRTEIESGEEESGLRTGWPSVDRIIKTGLMPGELAVLSAPPKTGKTTFGLQITTHNALHDIPSLFFCLEMRPRKVVQKIIQCDTRREIIEPDEIRRAEIHFRDAPLYLGYSYQKPTIDGIIDTLKAAVKRYGLKLVCFDHLHFLCRSISNQVQEVGLAVQAFKFLAEEMEISVLLIAQPRKIQADSIMTAMDLKDSSSIFSDCDHLIILHRKRSATAVKDPKEDTVLQKQAFEPITLVRVEASRYNAGGEALLYYHGEYGRFDPIQGDERYENE